MKIDPEIRMFRLDFADLDTKLKKYGRTLCRFHKNRSSRTWGLQLECHHPSTGYGGINRNTNCGLINCPRVIYNNEGGTI